jgi:hypothetical protein
MGRIAGPAELSDVRPRIGSTEVQERVVDELSNGRLVRIQDILQLELGIEVVPERQW